MARRAKRKAATTRKSKSRLQCGVPRACLVRHAADAEALFECARRTHELPRRVRDYGPREARCAAEVIGQVTRHIRNYPRASQLRWRRAINRYAGLPISKRTWAAVADLGPVRSGRIR